jgi:hypothetical protein
MTKHKNIPPGEEFDVKKSALAWFNIGQFVFCHTNMFSKLLTKTARITFCVDML